ncbi:MAG: GUN4 domain-containing protein [Xenococcaceae cyanobacterium]
MVPLANQANEQNTVPPRPPAASSGAITPEEAANANYTELEKLLAAKRWKTADRVTAALLLKISGRAAEGWITVEDTEKFPCSELSTIDQLWVKYSSGKFGFSVQSLIWQELGGLENPSYETWMQLATRLGWWVNNEWVSWELLTFVSRNRQGHWPAMAFILPCVGIWGPESRIARLNCRAALLARFATCQL